MPPQPASAPAFQLRFDPLSAAGRALCFPCDAAGRVDLDRLGERARIDYFFARTVVGRDFGRPAVRPAAVQ